MGLGGPTPALDSPNPVVRDEARRAGFRGGLRVPLLAGAGSHPTAAPAGAEALGTAISEITGLAVSGRSSSGAARRVLSSARFGLADTAVLMVADPTLQISVPIGDDLMPENVALAVDTLVGVRRWFGAPADHLTRVSFERVRSGGGKARWAGAADTSAFTIHLNCDFVLAAGFVIMSRHKAKRPENRPAAVRSGFTALDGTVAHEAWHQIEAGFAARRLADRTELRHQLGLSLGVETLEQAIKGGHPRAPEHWRAAHVRLRQLVSPYAATNPVEATAEMFKLWWCRISNPVVDRFGELLQELFGVAAR
jgi:hypothetical protein